MNRANSGIINLFYPIPTYGFAHTKVQKSIFNSKTLELVPNIGIILKDFSNWFYSATQNWVLFTCVENLKISEIQSTHRVNFTEFGLPEAANRLSKNDPDDVVKPFFIFNIHILSNYS